MTTQNKVIEEIQELLTVKGNTAKPAKLKELENGCIVCISHKPHHDGYLQLKRDGKFVYAHRIVYENFIASIPEELLVCHHCDNPSCLNPKHFFVGTHADNNQDMARKGRGTIGQTWSQGEKNVQAKLSDEKVLDIRRKYATGKYSQSELARKHGVSQRLIWNIIAGEAWKHLLPPSATLKTMRKEKVSHE